MMLTSKLRLMSIRRREITPNSRPRLRQRLKKPPPRKVPPPVLPSALLITPRGSTDLLTLREEAKMKTKNEYKTLVVDNGAIDSLLNANQMTTLLFKQNKI